MQPTNRAALTYYKTFIKATEKIAEIDPTVKSGAFKSQLSQMKLSLKNIRKIEPDFDTSTLEAELEKYNNTITSQDKDKSLDKDLINLNKGFEFFDKILSETKLNLDNIDSQVENSTKAIKRDLAIFKLKHITYDISSLETKILDFETKFRNKLQSAAGSIKGTNHLKEDLHNLLYLKTLSYRDYEGDEFISGSHNPTGNLYLPDYIWSQAGIDKLQSILDDYCNRFNDFSSKYNIGELSSLYKLDDNGYGLVSIDGNNHDYKVNSVLSFASNFYSKSKSELNEAKTQLKSLEEVSEYKVENYFNFKIKALQWVNAGKLFNNIPQIVEVGNKYQELFNAYGTMENYKNIIKNNSIKHARLVKMPTGSKLDDEIEALAKKAFENKGWNEEVLKVVLLGQDWRLERNSEWIIGRVYDVVIAAKQKSGICMLYNATIRQEDVEGRFSEPFISSYNSKAIAEENI